MRSTTSASARSCLRHDEESLSVRSRSPITTPSASRSTSNDQEPLRPGPLDAPLAGASRKARRRRPSL
eukprot:8947309-Heterocapsa_arctica.AAC.1